MMLFVVGNIDPKKTMQDIRENQKRKHFQKAPIIQRKQIQEAASVDKTTEILHMDVTMPKVIVSMKINDILNNSKERLKRELAMNLFLDLMFSKSSPLYDEWVKEKLINDTFSGNFTQERDYSFLQIGGDTIYPEQLKEKIIDFLSHVSEMSFDEEAFIRAKKKNIGSLIAMFNSPESIANLFSRYYFEGTIIFDLIDTMNTMTLNDLYKLKPLFNKDLISTFEILPLKK